MLIRITPPREVLGRSGAFDIWKPRAKLVFVWHDADGLWLLFGVKSLSVIICILLAMKLLIPISRKHWSRQRLTLIVEVVCTFWRRSAGLPVILGLLLVMFQSLLRPLQIGTRSLMLLPSMVKTIIDKLLRQGQIWIDVVVVNFLVHRHGVDGDHVRWRYNICRRIKFVLFFHGRRSFAHHVSTVLDLLSLVDRTLLGTLKLLLYHIYGSFDSILSVLLPRHIWTRAFGANSNLLALPTLNTFLRYLSL